MEIKEVWLLWNYHQKGESQLFTEHVQLDMRTAFLWFKRKNSQNNLHVLRPPLDIQYV